MKMLQPDELEPVCFIVSDTTTHFGFALTAGQHDNFRRLAEFLLSVDARKFHMGTYNRQTPDDPREAPQYQNCFVYSDECGSAACAAGWAVYAGILPVAEDSDWTKYTDRHFSPDERLWEWCFSPIWQFIDNSAIGAAQRIQYMLHFGVPKEAIQITSDGEEDHIALNTFMLCWEKSKRGHLCYQCGAAT